MEFKSIHIIVVLLILSTCLSLAQTGMTGIFKNSDDFVKGKVSYAGKSTQIKLHELLNIELLEVKYMDSSFSYLKNDVFGYADKKGFTYRFFNNGIYPILNPYENILLYKKVSGTGMKNSPIIETYFFSKNAGAEILPLTLENLERAFNENRTFTYILEIHFKNEDSLLEYDTLHEMYKLNRLMEISQHE